MDVNIVLIVNIMQTRGIVIDVKNVIRLVILLIVINVQIAKNVKIVLIVLIAKTAMDVLIFTMHNICIKIYNIPKGIL